MKYNFDEVVRREKSDAKKWTNLKDMYGREDILPMWVADMDFKSPREVIDAFVERSKHGVFGYTYRQDGFYNSVIEWCKKRYNWNIKKEWILYTPGVVMGLNIGVMQFSKPGEKVIVQPPVYPPFGEVVTNKERILSENPLKFNGDRFVMDYENLEKIIDEDTKLLMLCSPQNPVGRVWEKEELEKLGNICLKNNIPIISDEIHADFIFSDYKHIPLATISKELEQNTVTLLAPSKTFNIAGLGTSVAIIPNGDIRKKYEDAIEYMGIDSVDIYGALGLETAYKYGEEWLDELLVYLEDNVNYAIDYIDKNIPGIEVYQPEGTYLLWINFSKLNKSSDEIQNALINVGKVGLNDGRPYGPGGDKHFRLNIACPRLILEEGLKRIKKAVESFNA